MDEDARKKRLALLQKVREATQSGNPARHLEGRLARRFRDSLIQFQEVVRSDGRAIGEIDVELKSAIVEVTTGVGGGKVGQVSRLLSSVLNPKRKQVIVFGPHITAKRAQAIEAAGARVARSINELAILLSEA